MSERLTFAAAARFEAARRLETLHGHGFVASVRASRPEGLREALARAVAPLDYALLNERLDVPTDANLARWIAARVDLPGVEAVGVQSTAEAGVELDAAGRLLASRKLVFQAAHFLPHVPPGHKCGRMHGHRFQVAVQAAGDAAAIERASRPVIAALDGACLNEIAGLANPTSELIGRWLWQRLEPGLPALTRVTVFETGSCGAHFDGARHRIWKDFSMDCALRDGERRILGRTYTLRLHLEAALDERLGWTMDFGDVKERFAPVFARLDHQPLHEVLPESDPAGILHWIRRECAGVLPALVAVDLYESPGCGASLVWGNA